MVVFDGVELKQFHHTINLFEVVGSNSTDHIAFTKDGAHVLVTFICKACANVTDKSDVYVQLVAESDIVIDIAVSDDTVVHACIVNIHDVHAQGAQLKTTLKFLSVHALQKIILQLLLDVVQAFDALPKILQYCVAVSDNAVV